VPSTAGPHPAAVVVHGAAGGQRDFCRLQAQSLLDAGVAVLIYDKAGHGRSGGAADPSIFDQADAAEAGLALLAAHPDIDVRRIGLAGFSNGMWAVPMVAARRPVAFIAGVGSPGVSMAESEVHRRTKVLRDCGVGEPTIQAVSHAWRCIFAIVGSGAADTTTVGLLDRALTQIRHADDLDRYIVPDYVRQNPMLSSLPPPMPAAELVDLLLAEADPQVRYDPAVDYARCTCPVFLQYGADDTSVPVTASVQAISQAAGGRAVILTYPGLEHMLNVVPTLAGLSAEESMYQFHSFQFGPQVRHDVTGWLRTLWLS
jgi:pimeloyl-ACP methyl ester carboxylesterase